jgi:hypothetical protein
LLDQITAPLASFIGDGAYDQTSIYDTVVQRHSDAAVIVPPRSTAVLSKGGQASPTQRDRYLEASRSMGVWVGRRGPGTRVGLWWRPPSAGLNE